MKRTDVPDWFPLSNEAFLPIHKRIADAVQDHGLPTELCLAPQEALYFYLNSMQMAHDANVAGMHANALSQTRYCVEALSIVELGITRKIGREDILSKWLDGTSAPGNVRQWLAKEVWPTYGIGLWSENWESFMGNLARAVQPYAHYTAQLAQWQSRLVYVSPTNLEAYIESGPAVLDPQKATRITLYHAILNFSLARIWLARFGASDAAFATLVECLGEAIGRSRYLDGHKTDWDKQFFAMVWSRDGGTILE